MVDPWSVPPVREDYRAAALVMVGMGQENGPLAREALNAIEPGEFVSVPANTLVPFAGYAISKRYVTVMISGTRSFLQAILNVLGSVQISDGNFPGDVNAYFAATADSFLGAVGAELRAALPTRKLICLGHSLGGAVAQLLLSNLGPHAGNGALCISFGAPRVGNPVFADSLAGRVFRIEDTLDPIPDFPPTAWFGVGSPWLPFPGLTPAEYAHGGAAFTLDEEGDLTAGSEPIPLADVWVMIQKQALPSHKMEEYSRRLQLVMELPAVAFADPEELVIVANFQTPQFFIGGGTVATVQGIMYFSTNEEPAGWGESWFLNGTPPDMITKLQSLLTKRAAFLANDVSIIALRASVVDPAPAARSSIPLLLPTPVRGSAKPLNSSPNPQQTNETVDCIDFSVASVAVSRKTCLFRGVPDVFIAGSVISDTGRTALADIQSFLLGAKDASLGLRIYTRSAGGGPKPNVAITLDPTTGLINIKATAHGYPANPAFYSVTLRGIKSNPMLNGKWKAQTIDANNFQLSGSQRFNADADNDGSSQLYAFQVDPIASYSFSRVSTRKTGRVFNARRGKRSPRLLHH